MLFFIPPTVGFSTSDLRPYCGGVQYICIVKSKQYNNSSVEFNNVVCIGLTNTVYWEQYIVLQIYCCATPNVASTFDGVTNIVDPWLKKLVEATSTTQNLREALVWKTQNYIKNKIFDIEDNAQFLLETTIVSKNTTSVVFVSIIMVTFILKHQSQQQEKSVSTMQEENVNTKKRWWHSNQFRMIALILWNRCNFHGQIHCQFQSSIPSK